MFSLLCMICILLLLLVVVFLSNAIIGRLPFVENWVDFQSGWRNLDAYLQHVSRSYLVFAIG